VLCYLDSLDYPDRQSYVLGYRVLPDLFARVFLGYLVYDATLLFLYSKYFNDVGTAIHHITFIVVT
jgi:hypothetical protein